MRKRVVLLLALLLIACSPGPVLAGDGIVALQTATASCPDSSGNIYVDCNDNGTVTDNRTGLVWLANADCVGILDWRAAMEFVAGLKDIASGSIAASHDCGLTDGSSPGEWRLPSLDEWEAMIAKARDDSVDPDCSANPPTLTDDSGSECWIIAPGASSSFSDVRSAYYWSATSNTGNAWAVSLSDGSVAAVHKDSELYVWPVRGGQ